MTSTPQSTWFSCSQPRPRALWRLIGFPYGGGGPRAFRGWDEALPDSVMTDKPYVFFGHSVGAMVAFATARQLRARGLPAPVRLILSAHKAPHELTDEAAMSQLEDQELTDVLRQLGLVPEEALSNDELLAMILPPLRADFALSDNYHDSGQSPLDIPVSAFGGRDDDLLTEQDLHMWAQHTTAGFDAHVFDGDHFYTESHREELTAEILHRVDADFAARPPSVLHGPVEPYPENACLHDLFREQAAATPDAVAVVDGPRQITFAELDEQTDALSDLLRHHGVGTDKLVGLYLETCLEFVIGYLAVLKAGGAYLPLEVAYPPELLSDTLDAAQPVMVLTNDTHLAQLPAAWKKPERVFSLDPGWQQRISAMSLPDLPAHHSHPDDLAYCVMSSGTTGVPKGIVCPHRGAVNSYFWRYTHYPYQEDEREACNVFLVWEVIRPVLQGKPAYLIPDEVIYDPARLVDCLYTHRITRVLFLNGEVVTTQLQQRFCSRFPHITLLNDYSISETHDVCTMDLSELDPALSPKYAPLGEPMSNARIYLLDEDKNPVPQGLPGEIYVGGDSLARGYLNAPQLTAERFVPDPLREDGSLVFRTGDAGRVLDNGQLEIHGRIAFMVKLRGYSIVPGAVEAAIAEHAGVDSVRVVTLDDPQSGQPEHLVAYLVSDGSVPDGELIPTLRRDLKQKLPHYAVPSYLVPVPDLPLASSGKLDRTKLPDPRTAAATVADHLPDPPTGEREQHLANAWQELLGVPAVEADDNFFDLGGHSLLAAQLSAMLLDRHGWRASVIDIFQHPTLRTLADSMDDEVPATQYVAAGTEPYGSPPRPGHAGTDIAVIGLACRFPGAPDAVTFWANSRDGVRCVREISDEELTGRGVPAHIYTDPDYVKVGALLDEVEYFDPAFWSISTKEAVHMDPQHRLFLETCWHALENAGYAPRQDGQRTGVFGGCFLPSYLLHHLRGGGLLDQRDPMQQHLTEIGNDKDYLTTRVSHLLRPATSTPKDTSVARTGIAVLSTRRPTARSWATAWGWSPSNDCPTPRRPATPFSP